MMEGDQRRFGRSLQVSGTMMGKGNSGSPVFDMNGAVIGVVYGGPGESGGVSFATTVENIKALLPKASAKPLSLVEDPAITLNTRTRNLIISLISMALVGSYLVVQLRRSHRQKKHLLD